LENIIEEIDELIKEKLQLGLIDFIDAGCGTGGSIDYCKKRFGTNVGIGFDLDEVKIDKAQNDGYLVFLQDILKFDFPEKSVMFSSMMDFLEHLPNYNSAKQIIQTLGNASRDFLFIRHPNFDDIDYLRQMGLKLTWTDWTGHTNMMTVADYCKLFQELGWDDYRIIPQKRIKNSLEEVIIPLDGPTNINKFSQLEGFEKPEVEFDKPIFYQYDIYIKLNKNIDNDHWNLITNF